MPARSTNNATIALNNRNRSGRKRARRLEPARDPRHILAGVPSGRRNRQQRVAVPDAGQRRTGGSRHARQPVRTGPGRAQTTIRLRRFHLWRLFEWIAHDPLTATEDELTGYMAANQWAPETRKSVRASVRGFYMWADETGRIDSDPSRRLPKVSVPQGIPHPTPTPIVDAALDSADPRTLLMLMLAAYAGLRRAEIAGLHSRDVVGDTLVVNGKGGKVRSVPIHSRLADALRGVQGYVFPGKDHGHLSPDRVGRVMAAALGGEGWTAHSLRHRFATRAYATDRDLLTVQQLLGHSPVATTQR